MVNLLALLTTNRPVEFKTERDERLLVSGGELSVISADPWDNAGWSYGTVISSTDVIGQVLAEIIKREVSWANKLRAHQ